jgi:hypothetical protein
VSPLSISATSWILLRTLNKENSSWALQNGCIEKTVRRLCLFCGGSCAPNFQGRVTEKSIHAYWSNTLRVSCYWLHIQERKILKSREITTEKSYRKNNFQHSHRNENSSCLHQPKQKSHQVEYLKCCCLSCEIKFDLGDAVLWACPNNTKKHDWKWS